MKSTKSKIRIAIIAVTVLLSALVCIILPDTIAVQWNSSGASNEMSKYAAAIISVALAGIVAASWRSKEESLTPQQNIVWGLTSCIGILMDVVFLIFN